MSPLIDVEATQKYLRDLAETVRTFRWLEDWTRLHALADTLPSLAARASQEKP